MAMAGRKAPATTAASLELARSAVLQNFELCGCIIAQSSLETLAEQLLCVDRTFRDAVRARLTVLMPSLRPLLAQPFGLAPFDMVDRYRRHLCLNHRGAKLGDEAVSTLASACVCGAFAFVQELHLQSNQVGDAGLVSLTEACASGALARLTTLALGDNRIGDHGLAVLMEACAKKAGLLARLRELQLYGNHIGTSGLTALAAACAKGALPQLRNLFLDGNDIGDEGVVALADACSTHDALPRLKKLWLQRNSIGDAGLTALAKACNDGALAECLYIGLDDNRGSWRANRAVSDALKNRAVG